MNATHKTLQRDALRSLDRAYGAVKKIEMDYKTATKDLRKSAAAVRQKIGDAFKDVEVLLQKDKSMRT